MDDSECLEGVNRYLMALAKEQIRLAFGQSEKGVADLRQRTKEGIETARLAGKQIGAILGKKIVTMRLAGVSKNTYYKYRAELLRGMAPGGLGHRNDKSVHVKK